MNRHNCSMKASSFPAAVRADAAAVLLTLILLTWMLCAAPHSLRAQAPAPTAPDWAQPGSSTHVQVPPPPGFHRPSRNFDIPIGIFQGQSDIGAALAPGSATYDDRTKTYTINSAGYNIW